MTKESASFVIGNRSSRNTEMLEKARTRVEKESKEKKGRDEGILTPPYDLDKLADLYEINTYHSRAIQLKASLVANLGYTLVTDDRNKNPDKEYENIIKYFDNHFSESEITFSESLYNFTIDRLLFGNAYLEIVRNMKREVSEFHHLHGKNCRIRKTGNKISMVQGVGGDEEIFDRFGERTSERNEFIQWKNYSPRSFYYGVPEYIGALGAIALDRSAVEFNIRRFDNNLMIESIITLIGGKLSKQTETDINDFFSSNFKGVKKAGNSLLLQFEDGSPEEIEIKIEKIAAEIKDASYRALRGDTKMEVIAAHGVPPRLMSIVEGGRIGGGSEVKDQLRMFRDTEIKPLQRQIEFILNKKILSDSLQPNKWRVELNSFDVDDAISDAEFFSKIMSFTDATGEKVLDTNEIRQDLGYKAREIKTNRKPDKQSLEKGVKFFEALSELRKVIEESL